jgi:hypothetical protein
LLNGPVDYEKQNHQDSDPLKYFTAENDDVSIP